MPIHVECPGCRALFRVADQYGGKRGKCPKCKVAVSVPVGDDGIEIVAEPAPKPKKAKPSQSRDPILQALQGSIDPVKPTPLYRFWIIVVAAIMIVLPLIYLALIGLVLVGLGWHATHNARVFAGVRNIKAALILYVGPLAAGAVVVAFMLKPLFARPVRKWKSMTIEPAYEPRIYAFVDEVCQTIGAPTPSRIDVDCRVNASAHLDGGPLAFGKGLVLTIGLPLVAGLDLRQFTGVLAHEFGHFSQRAGMRLSGLIAWINHWFARVVYERDTWDETLQAWSTSGEGGLMMVAIPVRVAVWITRRILWVLMMTGHLISGFLSRQMEFDADRYQARMVGGNVLAGTMERIGVLSIAENGAYSDLSASWRERRLPDNLPKLVLVNVSQIPDELRQSLKSDLTHGKTGLFDTHPADSERIASAQAEETEGLFHLDGQATDLFHDFDALARTATFEQYRTMIGTEVSHDQLYPVEEAIEGSLVAQRGNQAFDRYFLEDFSLFHPLVFASEYPRIPENLKAAKQELVTIRKAILAGHSAQVSASRAWTENQDQAAIAGIAALLLRAGDKIKAADFGLEKATVKSAEAAVSQAEVKLNALDQILAEANQKVVQRLRISLSLLEAEAVVTRIADGFLLRDEARGLYPYAAFLGIRVVRELGPVFQMQQKLGRLLHFFTNKNNSQNQSLIKASLNAASLHQAALIEFQAKIGQTMPYPFEHAQNDISLCRFLVPFIPTADAVGDLLGQGEEAIDKVLTLNRRILGRLAVVAEEVERAVGLPPLVNSDRT